MSSFGAQQANREIWEADPEAQRLQSRIRDMILVIALDSLCITEAVTINDEDKSGDSLLRSKDKIIAVHLFLLDQSDDLAPSSREIATDDLPVWPMPIICLAWAILLWSLPPDLVPASPGYDGPIYQEFATRALQVSSGLFPWLEQVMTGPLFDSKSDGLKEEVLDEGETTRRVVLKGSSKPECCVS